MNRLPRRDLPVPSASIRPRPAARLCLLLLAGLLCLLTAGAASARSPIDVEKIAFPPLPPIGQPDLEEITLDNGLRLYLLVDRSLPLIQASVRIHGGSFLEPPDKIGLAEICGRLLRIGGTASYTSDQLDDLLEGIGAVVETSFETISGRLSLSMLSSQADLAVEVMAEILRRPAFEPDRLAQVMVAMRAAVSRRNDQPAAIATREFDKLIYGAASPYARHPENATLRAITRDDLVAFHRLVCQPQNIQMAIYGDIDRARIIDLVKKAFGDWPKGDTPLPDFPAVEYAFTPKVGLIDLPQANQSNILLGHLGGRLLDPDHAARLVMNNIFGISFGSRLFREVRSRAGLAYSVYGAITANMSYPGQFICSVSTRADATLKAVAKIIAEIERLQQEPPTAEELRLGKDRYLNAFVFNFENLDKIVDRLMYFDFFGLPRDFLQQEKARVEAVTTADVQAVARKQMKPEALRVLVVGPAARFDGDLKSLGLGAPEPIDITIAP
ncbi:MAG: processing proteinase [Candidatus Ozemobacter sibiricus]|uniref:Processing proteinase n=1 Tax=Candidatus Ozemobacter sibiricus TaxID=2268124 RepID=A0A367ZLL6_9BACT|nr:MAG: processing proteinase [Candidatus Ozemobacter sibiricus]